MNAHDHGHEHEHAHKQERLLAILVNSKNFPMNLTPFQKEKKLGKN